MSATRRSSRRQQGESVEEAAVEAETTAPPARTTRRGRAAAAANPETRNPETTPPPAPPATSRRKKKDPRPAASSTNQPSEQPATAEEQEGEERDGSASEPLPSEVERKAAEYEEEKKRREQAEREIAEMKAMLASLQAQVATQQGLTNSGPPPPAPQAQTEPTNPPPPAPQAQSEPINPPPPVLQEVQPEASIPLPPAPLDPEPTIPSQLTPQQGQTDTQQVSTTTNPHPPAPQETQGQQEKPVEVPISAPTPQRSRQPWQHPDAALAEPTRTPPPQPPLMPQLSMGSSFQASSQFDSSPPPLRRRPIDEDEDADAEGELDDDMESTRLPGGSDGAPLHSDNFHSLQGQFESWQEFLNGKEAVGYDDIYAMSAAKTPVSRLQQADEIEKRLLKAREHSVPLLPSQFSQPLTQEPIISIGAPGQHYGPEATARSRTLPPPPRPPTPTLPQHTQQLHQPNYSASGFQPLSGSYQNTHGYRDGGMPSSDAPIPSSDAGTDSERKAKRQRMDRQFYASLTDTQAAVLKSREIQQIMLNQLWYFNPFFYKNATMETLAQLFRDKFIEIAASPTYRVGNEVVLWNIHCAKQCKMKCNYFMARAIVKVKEFLRDPSKHAYELTKVECQGKRTIGYLVDQNRFSAAPEYYSHDTPNLFTFTSPEIINFIHYYFYDTDKAVGNSVYPDWSTALSQINGTFLAMITGLLKAGLKQWPFPKGVEVKKDDWKFFYLEFLQYWKRMSPPLQHRLVETINNTLLYRLRNKGASADQVLAVAELGLVIARGEEGMSSLDKAIAAMESRNLEAYGSTGLRPPQKPN